MAALELDELDLPVFVYGTLRPQKGNAAVWRENGAFDSYDGRVFVHGWRMKATGIPYAVRTYDDDDTVTGCLIYPPVEFVLQVGLRWALDSLEGHPNNYVRRKVTTWIPSERRKIEAWIYDATAIARGELVPSGDYYEYRR